MPRLRLYRRSEPPRGWRTAAILVTLFAGLTVVTRLLCMDAFSNSSIWPANAALVTAFLVLPSGVGWLTAASCFAVNLLLNAMTGYPRWENFVLASLNVVLSVCAALLTRSFCGAALDLSRFRRMSVFILIAFASAGVEACLGDLVDWQTGPGDTFDDFLQWSICDGLGLVMATPAILLAVKSRRASRTYDASVAERWLLLSGALALATAAFWWRSPLYLLVYPVLVLIAFRAGPAWVLMSVLLVGIIVSALTVHGHGPLVTSGFGHDMVQPYLVTLFLATIPANNALGERARAAQRLGRMKAHVEHGATHDELTTLVNRKLFRRRLAALLEIRAVAWVMFVDLDRFKQVNDTFGHQAGDELLRSFSARLLDAAPAASVVARFGGDEFAVLVGASKEAPSLERVCTSILTAAQRPFALSAGPAHVSASIGVALASQGGGDAGELMRRADIALYAAKASGRDGYRIFNDELDRRVLDRIELEADLRAALDGAEGLFLAYQPKVDRRGLVTSVEVLTRWRHPRHDMIEPTRFIAVAEETGLILRLGLWVLREATAFAERWPSLGVAINVSPVQLRQPDFADEILAIVDARSVAPERLEVEVTETALLDDNNPATENLRKLRAAGLRVSLDDFGTGYSSLRHLHRFAVDRVKIDQSFVSTLGDNRDSRVIVQAIIQLGHAMGLQVTAEGVETDDQRCHLLAAGVDELQGYLFSRPVEEADLMAVVEASKSRRRIAS